MFSGLRAGGKNEKKSQGGCKSCCPCKCGRIFCFFAGSDHDDDDNEAGEDEKAGESLVLQTLMRWTAAVSQR